MHSRNARGTDHKPEQEEFAKHIDQALPDKHTQKNLRRVQQSPTPHHWPDSELENIYPTHMSLKLKYASMIIIPTNVRLKQAALLFRCPRGDNIEMNCDVRLIHAREVVVNFRTVKCYSGYEISSVVRDRLVELVPSDG